MQEIKKVIVKVPQAYLDIINQLFEIEKKATNIKEDNSIYRNTNRIKGLIEEGLLGGHSFTTHNPIGEDYKESRTDCEATISGTGVDDLEIIEVIRPIIFYTQKENENTYKTIAQPAVVIVQSKNISQ